MLLLLTSLPALAQVNVETLAARADHEGFGALSKVDLGLTSGNVETLYVKGEAEAHWIRLQDDPPDDSRLWFRDRFVVAAHYARKSYKKELADNEAFVHVRHTHMFKPRLGTDVFGQLQFDEFHLLDRRLLGGAGVRLDAVHNERLELWLGTGYMAESEHLNVDPPEATNVLNHRWTSYASFNLMVVPDTLTLLGTTYIQPRFDDFEDVQVLSEWFLDFHVNKYFSLGPDVLIRYDSQPPGDLKALDYGLYNNLTLKI